MNSLFLYMSDVEQHPLLSAEQEKPLARAARAGDASARERMISSNLRLVVKLAQRYRSLLSSDQFMDLIQEGNLGLMRAVELFNPDKGYRFSTFATWWIWQGIYRYVYRMRTPYSMHNLALSDLARLRKCWDDLRSSLGRDPTVEDLSHQTGIPLPRVRNVYPFVMSSFVSLSDPINIDHDDCSLGEIIVYPDDDFSSWENEEDNHQMVESLLSILSPSELKVIEIFFGFHGYEPSESNGLVAKHFGFSKQRAYQLRLNAINRMRRSQLEGVS